MLKLDPKKELNVLISDDMARIWRTLTEDPLLVENIAQMQQMLRQLHVPEKIVTGFTDYIFSICRYCWSRAEIETVKATVKKLEGRKDGRST